MMTLTRAGLVLRLLALQERAQIAYFVANAVVLPCAIAYVASRTFDQGSPAAFRWATGSVVLGAGAGSLSQVGFAMLVDRMTGRLQLLKVSAVGRSAYLTAYFLIACSWAVALSVIGFAVLCLFGSLVLSLRLFIVGTAVAVASALVHGSIGAYIGIKSKRFEEGAGLLVILSLGIGFIAPVLYPHQSLPFGLGQVLRFVPLSLAAELTTAAASGSALDALPLLALSAFALTAVVTTFLFAPWEV